jgi:hypothetical protein
MRRAVQQIEKPAVLCRWRDKANPSYCETPAKRNENFKKLENTIELALVRRRRVKKMRKTPCLVYFRQWIERIPQGHQRALRV